MSKYNYYSYPEKSSWATLVKRPALNSTDLKSLCSEVFLQVEKQGDAALLELTKRFDKVALDTPWVDIESINEWAANISKEMSLSIYQAYANITAFHKAQIPTSVLVETVPGVVCRQVFRAIERIGIYIPGGTAPLVSTVLMLAIPAQLAGCKEIVLATPPNKEGKIDPAICFAAKLCGIDSFLSLGGVQAIAAMAVGTQTIKPVYKLFGPGNQYVTAAKSYAQEYGIAIDLPAGPSELLVIADKTANPDYLAADLLSQAEHGVDSQVVLLSTEESLFTKVFQSIERLTKELSRRDIIEKSLQSARFILLSSLNDCIKLSNMYAPEHLILAVNEPEYYLEKVVNAGSVFLGHNTPESLGDYASGTNHTLPTSAYAKSYSGVNMDSFIKKITVQEATKEGISLLAPTVEQLALAEGLDAHALAATIRKDNKEEDL